MLLVLMTAIVIYPILGEANQSVLTTSLVHSHRHSLPALSRLCYIGIRLIDDLIDLESFQLLSMGIT